LVLMTPQERTQRTLDRKLREAILAVRLSRAYDKDTLLEMYLNEVYYGNLAYGVEAAAQGYFGVHARDLDLAQCALLAGLPQAPSRYNPLVYYDEAKARQEIVLGLMAKQGYITREQADQAFAEPLHFVGGADGLLAPHFVVYVRNQLEEMLGREALMDGGWVVVTSLDLDLQLQAEAIVQRRLEAFTYQEVTTAALVALDPLTGEVLVMVGSADYFDAEIDGAVNGATALRQPGSAIKPFLYAAAFDSGEWTPASVVYDVRTVFVDDDGKTYIPANHDGVYHGSVTLREALGNSYNLPAVILQDRVGTDAFLVKARDFGLTTLHDSKRYGLTLTLGGSEVTLLDMTTGYAVLATGGLYRPPVTILSIVSADGALFDHIADVSQDSASAVIVPQTAYLITNILSDNDARAASFGYYSPLVLSRPAAAKTGTTTNWRDNWTLGYTPDLVTGVWMGNANGAPMRNLSGVEGAGPIWHDFMKVAHHGLPVRNFIEPEGLVWRDICPVSGSLAGPDCPHSRREVFIAGTEPLTVCDQHVRALVDRRTGEPAGSDVPDQFVVEKVFWAPPPELREWARERDIPLAVRGETEVADRGVEQPVCKLVSPDYGAAFEFAPGIPRDRQSIAVEAEVHAPDWPLRVTLYVDGRILATVSDPPYRATWTLEAGVHTFRAVAETRDGRLSRSEPVTIFVDE
jgi:membrane peptidoglycan carboxypeptidase